MIFYTVDDANFSLWSTELRRMLRFHVEYRFSQLHFVPKTDASHRRRQTFPLLDGRMHDERLWQREGASFGLPLYFFRVHRFHSDW